MEGVAGIEHYGECLPSHRSAYARGRRLMTDEVLASIDALRSEGIERITVGDWHMVGTDAERERLPDGEKGSRGRSMRRRVGSLIATPSIRAKERSWLGSARRG